MVGTELLPGREGQSSNDNNEEAEEED